MFLPKRLSLLLTLLFLFFVNHVFTQTSVLTQHNNINRTGWYDQEKLLNKNNVKPGAFGKLFSRPGR
jgi:hypothetical protein